MRDRNPILDLTMTTSSPVTASWRPQLPPYLKQTVPSGPAFGRVRSGLREAGLASVCEQALCPNRTDCWARGTLAFQILGNICTRRCAFCAEETGNPLPADPNEPARLVAAAKALNLHHVVITSPTRDDLSDQGAGHFATCVLALRQDMPQAAIETLTPDFQVNHKLLNIVFSAKPDIFNHNLETVSRLTPLLRNRATYKGSLDVLEAAAYAGLVSKSGLMVGLGESEAELFEAFEDLSGRGVRFLTIGQYLPPSSKHFPVQKFYTPDDFQRIGRRAERFFERVMVGPLVRSSYHADEMPLIGQNQKREVR